MILEFAKKIKLRENLANGDQGQKNFYAEYGLLLKGKPWYLLGWNEEAFAIVDRLGTYEFHYFLGSPCSFFEEDKNH